MPTNTRTRRSTNTSRRSTTRTGTRATGTRASSSRSNGARRRTGSPRDAIAVLRAQHREVEKLFRDFERSSDGAQRRRRSLVDQMVAKLSQHAAIEEQHFYPTIRREAEDLGGDVLEALEEHHVVKWELDELTGLDPSDERFVPKVTVMMENVRHHVREEEGELFPEVRAALGRKRLLEVGTTLESAIRTAPTRPHPRSPSTPPANLVTAPLAGAVDKARDLIKSGGGLGG